MRQNKTAHEPERRHKVHVAAKIGVKQHAVAKKRAKKLRGGQGGRGENGVYELEKMICDNEFFKKRGAQKREYGGAGAKNLGRI